MTGFGSVQSAVEAMKKGAHNYFLKPFSLEILEEGIEAALRQNPTLQNQDPRTFVSSYHHPDYYPRSGSERNPAPWRKGCPEQGDGADSRGERHRKGTSGPVHSRAEPEKSSSFCGCELRLPPETLLESELFGHEKRGIHRGHRPQNRQIRAGPPGDDPPG